MKIEKVNDNQIRCTLTKSDLIERQIKISELAYGTEKAKSLFRDMMQQASYEYGFEAEDIPLMIEAIPINSECIVLVITKVEDPEELDTRFSKFAPSIHESTNEDDYSFGNNHNPVAGGADDVLDLFKRLQNHEFTDGGTMQSDKNQKNQAEGQDVTSKKAEKTVSVLTNKELTKIYALDSLQTAGRISKVLKNYYQEKNSIYKNPNNGKYLLVLTKGKHTPEEFNKVCNILSEYGSSERYALASEVYLEEHFEPLIKNTAIQDLATL